MGISVGGLDLEDAIAYLEYGDVEGAAAEVVDRYLLLFLLLKAVGQRRCRRLVYYPLYVEAGYLAGVLCSLPLGVVKVRGDRYDRLCYRLAEIRLSRPLELLEYHRRYLWRGKCPAHVPGYDYRPALVVLLYLVGDHLHLFVDFLEVPPHEPLYGKYRVLRVGNSLPLGDLADEYLLIPGEGDHRGGYAAPLLVDDDLRLPGLHYRDNRVGGAEVNADNLSHLMLLLLLICVLKFIF